jgi:hypothetical protein
MEGCMFHVQSRCLAPQTRLVLEGAASERNSGAYMYSLIPSVIVWIVASMYESRGTLVHLRTRPWLILGRANRYPNGTGSAYRREDAVHYWTSYPAGCVEPMAGLSHCRDRTPSTRCHSTGQTTTPACGGAECRSGWAWPAGCRTEECP